MKILNGHSIILCNDNKLHVLSYDAFAKKLKKEHKLTNGRKIEDDGKGNKNKKVTIWFIKRLTDEEKTAKKEDEEEL